MRVSHYIKYTESRSSLAAELEKLRVKKIIVTQITTYTPNLLQVILVWRVACSHA